jgi:hypothetical protein
MPFPEKAGAGMKGRQKEQERRCVGDELPAFPLRLPTFTHSTFVEDAWGLVRLFPIHMDWMGLEKIVKKFDLFGIQTHPIPLNPHGLRANRTSPEVEGA